MVSAEYRLFDPGLPQPASTPRARISRSVRAWRRPRCPTVRRGITPRPIMRGPQTATVVGPSGEEIFTDEYARVKVQFHWDRLGKKDENSSCFVRVSQTWAGAGWGFIQIPRIGQEVIVDFIEGDPDRPIITGRVYNAAEMPPYGLPGSATQSGWKSNSSPGRRRLQRADVRGQGRVRTGQFPGAEGPQAPGQERPRQAGAARPVRPDRQQRQALGRASTSTRTSARTRRRRSASTGRSKIGSNDTESVGVNRSLTVGVERDDRRRVELDRDDRREPHPDRGADPDGDGRGGARRQRSAPPRRGPWARRRPTPSARRGA